jgi:hypothetical protein
VLVEVLVTVLLLAMVVGALLPLLTSGQQGFDYARRRQAMTRAGRTALDKLVRETRAAASFRTLAPGQISFTLQWGDGTGAEPTVQYSLNAVTHNLEYRWSANWDYRERVTVRAQDAVPSGYAVVLAFNHAALVAAGKSLASGDDVRMRYWNGSSMVELDRVLDPTSAWNAAATTVWFRLQAPIAAGRTDANYYLFYGNLADANPPAYGPNVFLDYQDGTSLDGWIRRDALPGAYAPSAINGFVFQAALGTGFRELTKNVPHGDVEIFWGFSSAATDSADGHDADGGEAERYGRPIASRAPTRPIGRSGSATGPPGAGPGGRLGAWSRTRCRASPTLEGSTWSGLRSAQSTGWSGPRSRRPGSCSQRTRAPRRGITTGRSTAFDRPRIIATPP